MATAAEPQVEKKDKRPSTSHLKTVPETRDLRDRVRVEAARVGKTFDRSRPLTKQHLQATAEQLLIREANSGLMAAPAGRLRDWLLGLGSSNAQREYYLTDVVAGAVRGTCPVEADRAKPLRVRATPPSKSFGVAVSGTGPTKKSSEQVVRPREAERRRTG